ncbi:MAG: AmmeMemoRadiSam system protein A [Actinobacteria bacterium]|nr:AmmeMemoRadiSam system protein A [Actinomycetota bacterium]
MESMSLNDEQKKVLLEIARKTIENAAIGKNPPDFDIDDPVLNIKSGAFVTIHNKKNLRGCIGNIVAQIPLWKTIEKMAIEASMHDPRFPSLSPKELGDIDIEISVLSPFKKITDINEIEVGKHGIFIKQGFYQGLLLPQVATDYGWNRTQFLEYTCQKAGLGRECYKEKNCEIFIFSATIFSEKEIN